MEEDKFHVGVKALVRDRRGNILISRAPRERWDLPGGRMKRGEKVPEALRRELEEELGVKNFRIGWLHDAVISDVRITSGNETHGLCLLVYRCMLPSSEPLGKGGSDEHKWAPKSEVRGLLSNKYPARFLDGL
jgi:8-oxo-dGTP pyrophosphatase MutT (NUDIX family)